MNFLRLSILVLPVWLLLGSFTTQERISWEDFNEGYPKARKQKKMVMIDAYTTWCWYCKKMDRETYANPEVVKKIKEHFVAIRFNPEIDSLRYMLDGKEYSGSQLLNTLSNHQQVRYPSVFFINTKKNTVSRLEGYQDPGGFVQFLDRIIQDANP